VLWVSWTTWWRVFIITNHKFSTAFLGSCVIGVMITFSGGSLFLQMTSVPHQEKVHFPAFVIIVIGFILSKVGSKIKLSEA